MFQVISQIGTFWKCLTLLIVLFLAWCTPAPAYAFDVTLQWDPNTETNLAGYKVYYKTETSGPPYNGTGAVEGKSPIDVGNVTQFTLHSLDEDVTYFFAVRAYNTNYLYSGFSNEVSAMGVSSNSSSDPPPSYSQPEDTSSSAEEDDHNGGGQSDSEDTSPSAEEDDHNGGGQSDSEDTSPSVEEDDHDGDGLSDSEDPDDDNDGLSDIWEEAYGLDPLDSTGINGWYGDFDGDGWSNHGEYKNETDPADSTSVPSLIDILIAETIPKNLSGVNDDDPVQNNASFSIRIEALNGIDTSNTASVVFTVKEGSKAEYTRDLSDIDVMKVLSLTNEADTNISHLWISYYRSEEIGVFYPYNKYVYDTLVTIKVEVTDREGFFFEQAFTFRVETNIKYITAQKSVELLDISTVDPEDPDLEGEYDAGIQIDRGDLAGARIIYNSNEPLTPKLDFSSEIPLLDVEGMNGVGMPLVLQPHTVFTTPVKVFIPCPEYPDINELCVMFHNGEEWVPACDENGEILPGGEGWMVPVSRVNHNNGDPSTIEIQVYHFSAVQAAAYAATNPIIEDTEEIAEEVVDEIAEKVEEVEEKVEDSVVFVDDAEEAVTSSGSGGGCFINTATPSSSNKGLHTNQGKEILNLSLISVFTAILILVITRRLRALSSPP